MTEIELAQAIRDYILTLYKACYIGWLQVEKLNPGYKMSIGIPSYMFPTTVAGDWGTDEEFLNFIYEDLRIRNYMRVYFYKVHRTTRNEEEGRSCEPPAILCRPVCDPNYTDYQGIYGERTDPQPENIEDPTGSITISKIVEGLPNDNTSFSITITGQREVNPYEISGWVSQQEPLLIAELPFDDYVITETAEEGYTLSGIADSPVTIDANTPDVDVVVTNAVDVVITSVKYGALYNWYAGQDLRKISSSNDWELPSYNQVVELTEYVGGGNIAGEKLKEIGGIYWDLNLIPEYPEYIPNEGTDDFGLHLRGCGFRRGNSGDVGTFENKRISFMAHISTDPYWMMYASVYYAIGGIGSAFGPDWGFSILLLRASTTLTHSQTGTYTGNDGTIYSTICIGTQEWLSVPLAETKYRNGELIPNVTNNETWAALTSGAMCYYDNDINNA